jgi:hypothetical protein
MASSRIRAMLQSDVPFVKKGLGEIFLRSTFEDFRVFLTEEVAEQRAWRDFETNRNNEKTKLKVFVAASNHAIGDTRFVDVTFSKKDTGYNMKSMCIKG